MPLAGALVGASDAIAADWTAYTPTYGGITIGNATVVARYLQVQQLVFVRFHMTVGSTTSFSAAVLTVSCPVTPSADYLIGDAVGSIYLLDSSVGITSRRSGTCGLTPSVFFFLDQDAGGTVAQTVPWTWATSDILSFNACYESA
jgi:uncharacterized membrane protein